MRLRDEKRAGIDKGDTILFTNVRTGETLFCEVLAVYAYADFEGLYRQHSKTDLGYLPHERANPDDMLAYYPVEKVAEFGVLAIELRAISPMI